MQCRTALSLLLAVASSLASACTGTIGDAAAGPRDGPTHPDELPLGPGAVTCEDADAATADGSLRRLSRHELTQTLRALFPADVIAEASVWIDSVPLDPTRHSPAEFEAATTQAHVDAIFEVTSRVAELVSRDDAALGAIAPPCMLEASPTSECVLGFVASFGRRVLKRPLRDEEIAAYVSTFGADDEGIVDARDRVEVLLTAMLNDPELTHRVIDREGAGERVRMSAYSVAARLSYAVTGAPPDEALLESAESEAIFEESERELHARRLLESPEGRAHVRQLFDRWLGLYGKHSPESAASLAGMPVDGLFGELRGEALDFVEHVVFEERGTFGDLMTSDVEVPSTERLAAILGEAAGSAPVASGGRRAGLLSRPAVLISDNARTSPILRGVFVLERFLCRTIPSPPPNADDVAMETLMTIDPDRSTSRVRAATMTGSPSCQSCHAVINAPGFALTGFGPLGEEWDEEVVFASPGEVLTTLPIDGDDRVEGFVVDGVPHTLEGALGLATVIAESEEGQSCAARQIVRATHLRDVTRADACLVHDVQRAIEDGVPILDVLVQSAARESIHVRGVE
ncbi:MAG: DUF1588 domain-containing protein [Myxococcota bacterium]|nr:DUF1588 domain-containing protein [Myxococcota bacterium]